MTVPMINLFQPVPTTAPTTILGDSAKLNPKDMVKNMNDMFVIMVPKNSRAIRGEVNIKKFLYKDVVNPHKFKQETEFTEEEKKMAERYKAVKNVSAVIKSFLPARHLETLNDYAQQVRNEFRKLCVSPNLNYMTRENSEEFTKFVKEIIQKQDATIELIVCDWSNIQIEFERQLKLAIPDITEDELRLALASLPSPEKFKKSYENTFVFQTMGFDSMTTQVDFRSDKVKTAQEVAEDDFKEIIGGALAETMTYLDGLMASVVRGKIENRTRGFMPEISVRLSEKTKFTGNYHIEAIVAKCEILPDLVNNINVLTETIEDIATDIYYLLSSYEMLSFIETINYQKFELEMLEILSDSRKKKAKTTKKGH